MAVSAILHTVTSTSPDETRQLAASLAQRLTVGDLLVLTGDLGAGKTQFTKGVAVGLGVSDLVTSPTFALHQRYQGRVDLHHLDVYRLEDLSETLDLDLYELCESGVTVIEWGDTIESVLPPERLVVRITAHPDHDDHRIISFESEPEGADRWRSTITEAVAQ